MSRRNNATVKRIIIGVAVAGLALFWVLVAIAVITAVVDSDEDSAPAVVKVKPASVSASPTRVTCSNNDLSGGSRKLQEFVSLFSDAFSRAGSTARIALGDPIADMQQARRDISSANLPDCMETYREALIDAHTAGIDAWLAFQANEPESALVPMFEEATRLLNLATSTLRALER